MKAFRKSEGFTLVELMVVVLIIGILVAIAIPVFNSAKANAQKKSCFANQRTIEGAAQTYAAENDGIYPAAPANLSPVYIKAAIQCPLAGANPPAWGGYGAIDAVTGGLTIVNPPCTHGHFGG